MVILNGFSSGANANNDPTATTTTIIDDDNDNRDGNNNNNENDNENKKKITITLPNQIHKTLMAAMFKHMFPPMNIASMRLSRCKRIVFINYNNAKHCIDIRHYKIKLGSVNVPRPIKKLVAKHTMTKKNQTAFINQNKRKKKMVMKIFLI